MFSINLLIIIATPIQRCVLHLAGFLFGYFSNIYNYLWQVCLTWEQLKWLTIGTPKYIFCQAHILFTTYTIPKSILTQFIHSHGLWYNITCMMLQLSIVDIVSKLFAFSSPSLHCYAVICRCYLHRSIIWISVINKH